MSRVVRSALLILAAAIGALVAPAAGGPVSAAQDNAAGCRQWQECRQEALAAEASGDYARFHDLAWRTVQIGPRNHRDLMFLLARAQALSGRPHDALVMLQRLAAAGAQVDASGEAFARTRELPGWPAVEAVLAGGTPPAAGAVTPDAASSSAARRADARATGDDSRGKPGLSSPVAGPTAAAGRAAPVKPSVAAAGGGVGDRASLSPPSSASPASPSASALPGTAGTPATPIPAAPAVRSDAANFAATRFAPGGLAYDTVSQRFVIGDALTKKLIVVGVGGSEPTDMVRADSAGFEAVTAVEIDDRRGDLWVAGAGGALHRLQLVSGRPLKTYRPAALSGTIGLQDLAVGATGTVFGLDTAGRRLLALDRGGDELSVAMTVDLERPVSLALYGETTAFVAHAGGIARLDLRAHTSAAVEAADGTELRGIARLRAYHGTLLAVQRMESSNSWRLVRLTLNGNRRRVVSAAVLDDLGTFAAASGADGRPPFVAVVNDELYYVAAAEGAGSGGSYVIRRLALR